MGKLSHTGFLAFFEAKMNKIVILDLKLIVPNLKAPPYGWVKKLPVAGGGGGGK